MLTTIKGQLLSVSGAAVETDEEPAIDAMLILRLDGPTSETLTDLFALRARLSAPGARLTFAFEDDDDPATLAAALS